MPVYFKDHNGILHCVIGEMPLVDQRKCRQIIESQTNFRVKSAVLALVVDNPPMDEPVLA